MVVMWTLATHPERIGRLVARSDRLLPHRVAHTSGRLARTFSEGFAVAREPRDLAIAFVWSFPLWVSIAFQAWLVTRAFGIHRFRCPASFLIQAMLVIGVGGADAGRGRAASTRRIGSRSTTFFHAPNNAAVSAALVLHAVSFFTSVVPGVVIMAQRRHERRRPRSPGGRGPTAKRQEPHPSIRRSHATESIGGNSMKCPFCGHLGDKVVDSRESKEGEVIRRRRECLDCGRRFTSYERIDEIPHMVIKKDGTRERFERQKLIAGLLKACEKRPVSVAAPRRRRRHDRSDAAGAAREGNEHRGSGPAGDGRAQAARQGRHTSASRRSTATSATSARFMTELKDLLNAKD